MFAEKQCSECKETKDLTAFYRKRNGEANGAICKCCKRKLRAAKMKQELQINGKRCSKCREFKPLTEFNRNDALHGYQTYCKPCVSEYYKKRNAEKTAKLDTKTGVPKLDNALCQQFLGVRSHHQHHGFYL